MRSPRSAPPGVTCEKYVRRTMSLAWPRAACPRAPSRCRPRMPRLVRSAVIRQTTASVAVSVVAADGASSEPGHRSDWAAAAGAAWSVAAVAETARVLSAARTIVRARNAVVDIERVPPMARVAPGADAKFVRSPPGSQRADHLCCDIPALRDGPYSVPLGRW